MAFYWLETGSKTIRQNNDHPLPSSDPSPVSKDPYGTATKQLARRQAFVANDIMRAPVKTLPATATLEETRLLFKQSRFRHVPIVDSANRIIGIVSDRDVLREAAQPAVSSESASTAEDLPSFSEDSRLPVSDALPSWIQEIVVVDRRVADFMTKRILVGTPSTEIRLIARAMFEERIGSMPIIDEKNKLVGIITRSDILRTLVSHAPMELWI